MIIATLWITCQSTVGSDAYGQPIYGQVWREKVAPVKLEFTNQHTTVRTDSSGSHGNAYETTANVVLLLLPNSKVAIGDTLTVNGNKVSVSQSHTRYRVTGLLDHIEIQCTAWKQ